MWQRFVKVHECLIPDQLFVVDMMSLVVEDQQPVQALDSVEHRPARRAPRRRPGARTRAAPHRALASQPFIVAGACREHQASPKPLGTRGSRMWNAVKEAIQTTGRTLRFIAIIAVFALVAWIMSPH